MEGLGVLNAALRLSYPEFSGFSPRVDRASIVGYVRGIKIEFDILDFVALGMSLAGEDYMRAAYGLCAERIEKASKTGEKVRRILLQEDEDEDEDEDEP